MSLVMGAGMYLNGHIVERVGLDRLSGLVFVANLVAVAVLLAVALTTDGTPPFWLFVVALAPILFTVQMLLPNLTSAAMRPLAHVAGTAAAIFGVVPGVHRCRHRRRHRQSVRRHDHAALDRLRREQRDRLARLALGHPFMSRSVAGTGD